MVDTEEIRKTFNKWFLAVDPESVEVLSNGVVNVASDVDAQIREEFPNGVLPLQFGRIEGNFFVNYTGLRLLTGMPKEVTGSVNLNANRLKNLVGCTQKIGGSLRLRSMPTLESLEGFPTELAGFVSLDWTPTIPLLRTLLAKEGVALWTNQEDVLRAEKILNRYKGQGRAGAIDCKRELVAAGFEGNARW